MMGIEVPIIGDFHYNGHQLLTGEPACAEALAKYRINPGNVGFGKKRDSQFGAIIELAHRSTTSRCASASTGARSTRRWRAQLMDENAQRAEPWEASRVLREALIRSALDSAAAAVEIGLPRERIILSAQGQRRAGADRGVPRPGHALRFPAAPGPDRSRHGQQGHRRVHRRAGGAAAGRHRRHHPHLADARAGRSRARRK